MNGRVFKRGRTWSFVVDVGAHSDGRRRQQSRGGFATKREADRALRELLRTIDAGTYVAPSTLTVAEFLTGEWLPAMRPPKLRATTWTEYARKVRCHVLPRLGRLPLQQLSPAHLNAIYAELLTTGRVDGKGGLAPKTVREIHVIIHKALRDAVRWGRLSRNVAGLADPPSQRSAAAARRRTMQSWTPAEVRRFLAHDVDGRLHHAWVLAGTTGLRRSELLGLRWADVDLPAERLAVRQRLASVDGNPELSEPKSNSSGRVVDLDARTITALRKNRAQQAEQRLLWGPAWQNFDLVIAREDGRWIHPDWFSELFRRRVAALGLPPIRLHDLRHTHATLLLQAGVNPKIVSERLGHHSVAFTLDTYAHVLPGMQSEAIRRLADLVEGTTSEQADQPGRDVSNP